MGEGRELWSSHQERSRVELGTAILQAVISVDTRLHLQVASSFGRKTRHLPDEVVPRGEKMAGTETTAGAKTRTRTAMGTRT